MTEVGLGLTIVILLQCMKYIAKVLYYEGVKVWY